MKINDERFKRVVPDIHYRMNEESEILERILRQADCDQNAHQGNASISEIEFNRSKQIVENAKIVSKEMLRRIKKKLGIIKEWDDLDYAIEFPKSNYRAKNVKTIAVKKADFEFSPFRPPIDIKRIDASTIDFWEEKIKELKLPFKSFYKPPKPIAKFLRERTDFLEKIFKKEKGKSDAVSELIVSTDVFKIEYDGENTKSALSFNWKALLQSLNAFTSLNSISLQNLSLDDTFLIALSKSLGYNETVTILNLNGNRISLDAILAMVLELLTNFHLCHFSCIQQKSIRSPSHEAEKDILEVLQSNETLLIFECDWTIKSSAAKMNQILQRNCKKQLHRWNDSDNDLPDELLLSDTDSDQP